jgi:hypothetical protein
MKKWNLQPRKDVTILAFFLHYILVMYWCNSPQWASVSSFSTLSDHTQDTPHSEVHLWTSDQHDADNTQHSQKRERETSMFPVGSEPAIPASELP